MPPELWTLRKDYLYSLESKPPTSSVRGCLRYISPTINYIQNRVLKDRLEVRESVLVVEIDLQFVGTITKLQSLS